MAISEHENRQIDATRAVIAGKLGDFVGDFADTLPDREDIVAARREGEKICSILEPLGLPEALIAAVRVYPLRKAGLIASKDLQKLKIEGLPPDWQPGEALAVQQSEALRKMLLAVVSDARLVLVRIAEQLLRLRLAKRASVADQRALAVETQEIYAPLANRLGVWQFKWELEDLAFRYLEPDAYKHIAKTLSEKRNERESFIDNLQTTLQEELGKHDIAADISGRPKHIFSIWKKMQRKDHGLDRIFDIRAVRILVKDVAECYAALGIVHNLWSYLPGEFDDYIANPKENNYQSLHTAVIGPGGQTVEVQIRTHEMHRHAELGVAAHWRYKEGGTSSTSFDQKIHLLRSLLEPTDRDGDLLDQIRGDIFEDRVYAVSPKGDVVEMPANATPLDFAYHVHTQVGHRCRGAKVNGRIVPLTRIRSRAATG
jgi:GTP pyrophosphokinase